MEFSYSYWRSGIVIFVTLFFIILSIYGLASTDISEKDTGLLLFVIITFSPILLFGIHSIFLARNQKRRDKFAKMTLKEKRAYKLKKIGTYENNQ